MMDDHPSRSSALMNPISPPCQTSNQDEDRISVLPDHILLAMLSRVDLPIVIQASTLSKRWAHLPHSLTHLLIDVSHFLPRDKNKRKNRTVDQIMTTYTGVVRRLLLSSSPDDRAIERLQLSFYLADPYLHSISHAVGNVMERGNTKSLQFTIWADTHHPSYEHCVLLGQRFMSFFQACPSAFRWLTNLILQNLTFGDTDISKILNTCTKLEFLSLTYCDSVIDPVTGDDVVLTIDVPHSTLIALEITTCGYAGVDLIQAPKLQRLVCANWIGVNPPLRFGNVPHLHSITLRHAALHWQRPFPLSHCLSSTSSLSIIYLNFADQMIWIEPEDPKHLSPIFNHLRDVYLYNIFYECDLNWTMFVLEAAPSLSNFYLKLSRHPCERSRCEDSAKKVNVRWDQTSPDFKHRWLSLLEIVGFVMDEKLTKYIRLVIELAMGLKMIRLLDQEPCARCNAMNNGQPSCLTRWRFPAEEEEKNVIRQQLVDGLSSPVEISIG
ncbi:unnamed protein product [Urochloa humidicola]